jgi:Uma2 family endonuclease
MTAEAIAHQMPAVLTLDDLAVLNEADTHGHRYEMSPEGALSVMPLPGFRHAQIVNRLIEWLLDAGYTLMQIYQAVGLRIPGPDGEEGGRIPDLVVWNQPPAPNVDVWLPATDVAVVVEVISRSSRALDQGVKCDEYSAAGVRRYWTVDCDPAQTVTMYELAAGSYRTRTLMPLEWVLNSKPSDHLG